MLAIISSKFAISNAAFLLNSEEIKVKEFIESAENELLVNKENYIFKRWAYESNITDYNEQVLLEAEVWILVHTVSYDYSVFSKTDQMGRFNSKTC